MANNKPKRKKLAKKLLHKYRLVILNEDTFEERLSFRLNRLNVFVVGTSFAVFLIAITTILIAFTPLREYIPGYSSTALKRQVADLTYKTDSLVSVLDYNDRYLNNVKRVLTGEVSPADMEAEAPADSLDKEERPDPSEIDLSPGKEDLALREEVAMEDKYNLVGSAISKTNFVLFRRFPEIYPTDIISRKAFCRRYCRSFGYSGKDSCRWYCYICRVDGRNRLCMYHRTFFWSDIRV